ncbi:hypothetical protein [Ferruginibacter albus]|uniref:hypothetical protein n=1 Tax=Ferruginibacter albus TaxID=2875540 RepID=UPI001CC5624F|nr:hypothetical protein [Ferruginibacter albus]UAY52196.1 hypothetical protein K9M53_00540 [Ferruginibacter albus]
MKRFLLIAVVMILISTVSFGQVKNSDTLKIADTIPSLNNRTQPPGGLTPGANTMPNNTNPNAPVTPNTPSTAPSTSPGNPPPRSTPY